MNKKKAASKKRRPRFEAPTENHSELEADIADSSQEINTEAQNEGVQPEDFIEEHLAAAEPEQISFEETLEPAPEERVHLEFVGSELIRQKAPKVMELADSVVNEWQKDGQFKHVLPVDNDLAQALAQKAFRKAKDVEKKLEEKGVFMMARIGLDFAKSKLKKKD